MSAFSYAHRILALLTAAVALLATSLPATAQLNSQEQQLANRVINDSNQGRPSVTVDPILSAVARAKAMDMAKRRFFAHTDPDGLGANTLVRRAGYPLPSYYSTALDGNNIESLAAGYATVSSVWSGWMGSPDHKRHILAETPFFADQTALGVGYYEDASAPYRYYWVIITAPPAGAQLAITAPAANAALTTGSVTVTGTTSGTPATDRVEVRVENAGGSGDYVAATGRTNWSATVSGLAPGSNTLRIRSVTSNGTLIKETTRTVRRLVLSDLVVAVNGSGVVSTGFAGTTSRVVGTSYTIAAAPAPGFLFSHWSGGETSTNPRLTFVMREGLSITANFAPNPFLTRTGGYTGLITGDSGSHATSGLLRVIVSSGGVATGRVFLGGTSFTFIQKLDLDGDATITINRGSTLPALTLRLDLDADGNSQQLTGSLSDGTFFSTFTSDRAWQPGGDPSAFAGRYTLLLPPGGQNGTPDANGWAVLSVSSTGIASLAGRLADGTPLSTAVAVSKDGVLPLFHVLYSGTGSLVGTLRFRDLSTTDVDGSYSWFKPERPTMARFQSAFSVQNSIIGSRYVRPPAGSTIITLPSGTGNARIDVTGGNLSEDLAQTVTVTTTHLVRPVAPLLRSFTGTLNPRNGCFSGTFFHPEEKVARRFDGVVLQKQSRGAGYFLSSASGGGVTLQAAE